MHIFTEVKEPIISWDAAKDLDIISATYPEPMISMAQQEFSKEDLIKQFPEVFSDDIKVMPGEEFHIKLSEDAKPFCVNTPRAIPYAYREKLKAELEEQVAKGMIKKITKPTKWCFAIVVTPKKDNDRIRLNVEFTPLNKYVMRERYYSPTPADVVADIDIKKAKYKTVFDAVKGYHQCPLSENSKECVKFITPFGRFQYQASSFWHIFHI